MGTNKIAVFPGTFNPFTIGHKEVVDKALKIFDEVIILFAQNSGKATEDFYHNADKITDLFKGQNVKIHWTNQMVGDKCILLNADFIIRGVRNSVDYEYENNIAKINKELFPYLTTIFIPTDNFISSSFVRECEKYGKDISKYLP